jgi:hypothetical protein
LPRHRQGATELPDTLPHTSNADANKFVSDGLTVNVKPLAVFPNPNTNLLILLFQFDRCRNLRHSSFYRLEDWEVS